MITGAVYPEVAAILEAPERIRKEAAELLELGVVRRSMMKPSIIFDVTRPATRERPETSIAIELPYDRHKDVPPSKLQTALRSEVFEKLVEILEGEEKRSASL